MALDSNVTRLDGLSVTARPGAIAWDGQTAHELGPVARSDNSEGLTAYVWRAYADGQDLYVQREGGDGGWQDPILVATASGAVSQLNLTFDQNAREWLSWEQSGAVYVWWYDPQQSAQEVRQIGAGRTPVMRLDYRELQLSGDSDILLFYVSDANDRVEYVQQRDRLNTVYTVGLTGVSNLYLELLAAAPNNRLYLWYSVRDGSDNYTVSAWHSAPYPWITDIERVGVGPETLESASLREVITDRSIQPSMEAGPDTVESGSLREVITDRTPDVESAVAGPDTVESSTLRQVIIDRTPDVDSASAGPDTVESASLRQVIIDVTTDPESAQVGPDTVTGGSKA